MDTFLRIIMYIMTGLGLLMTVSFFISEIILDKKPMKWCYYIPSSLLNIIFGIFSPHLFVLWLFMLSAGNTPMVILIPLGFLLVTAGSNAAFFLSFFRKENFSGAFYWSLSLTSLFVISYWLCRLMLLFQI